MARLKAPADLPQLVKKAFTKARSDGDLHYFPTQVTILEAKSIPFQLRYSPALANKPKGPPPDPSKPHKPIDPFENPPPALKVADLGPSHFLVLNKFAVVPEHFILATTGFEAQTDILDESDLAATLVCIESYEDAKSSGEGDGLFAFFNCGEHSGASQPHRHIQLLPISTMRDGLDANAPWTVLADQLHRHRPPFATFSEGISLGISSANLHAAYLRLYQRACRAVAQRMGGPAAHKQAEAAEHGPALISYNLAMTKDTLVLAPRLAEGAKICTHEGDVIGSLALNGTVLAGTALVKSEMEWDALRKGGDGLATVLRGIGIPSDEIDEKDIAP